eukprot:scaffold1053_cov107-Isochrysis_galbana.AAC.6
MRGWHMRWRENWFRFSKHTIRADSRSGLGGDASPREVRRSSSAPDASSLYSRETERREVRRCFSRQPFGHTQAGGKPRRPRRRRRDQTRGRAFLSSRWTIRAWGEGKLASFLPCARARDQRGLPDFTS